MGKERDDRYYLFSLGFSPTVGILWFGPHITVMVLSFSLYVLGTGLDIE